MTWHYQCPECGQKLEVDWDVRRQEVGCPQCHNAHYPPTPNEDNSAYFGGDRWPKELESAVLALRGTTCAAPGCYREYSTLVHRRSFSKGGRTSVENLMPMCLHHARSKGEMDYNEWLSTLSKATTVPEQEPFEITFTAKKTRAEPKTVARPIRYVQPLAGKAGTPAFPDPMQLVAAAPFVPGPARRLVFFYDWELGAEGGFKVLLLAWPHSEPPDLATGLENLSSLHAFNEHKGAVRETGSRILELNLPSGAGGRWVGAAVLIDDGGKPVLGDFLLVGAD